MLVKMSLISSGQAEGQFDCYWREVFPSKVVAAEAQLSQENKQRQMPEIIVWFFSWTQSIGSVNFCEKQKIQAMYSTEDLSEHLVLFSDCKRLKQSRNTF